MSHRRSNLFNPMNKTKLSKMLSYVLRHQPEAINLKLDSEGWAHVDELIQCLKQAGKETTLSQLEAVVAENNKQRFKFSEDGLRIRANQGHSVDIDLKLDPRDPPEELYHGTATRFLSKINEEGLKPGSRRHVHLSEDRSTAKAVGQRHGKPVILIVRSGEMHRSGHTFYQSDNGVWLTESVPPAFFSE